MHRNDYSAGAVKLSFWFSEFRKVISLLNSGKSINGIKSIVENENIFSAASPMRSKQIFNTVSARVKILPPEFIMEFDKLRMPDQRIIALIAIMETDALFFDLMYDVYREKLIIGDTSLTEADVRGFFSQ